MPDEVQSHGRDDAATRIRQVVQALTLLRCGKTREIDVVALLEAYIWFEDHDDDYHAGMVSQLVVEALRGPRPTAGPPR